jgi:hypothetical protein
MFSSPRIANAAMVHTTTVAMLRSTVLRAWARAVARRFTSVVATSAAGTDRLNAEGVGSAMCSVKRRMTRRRIRVAITATTTISRIRSGRATRNSAPRAARSLSHRSSTWRHTQPGSSPQTSTTSSSVTWVRMGARGVMRSGLPGRGPAHPTERAVGPEAGIAPRYDA